MKNPILKLVNYDKDRAPLTRTDFTLDSDNHSNTKDTFLLENIANRDGIVYLHATLNVQKDKLYKVQIVGRSYDSQHKLMYLTKFVVYLYLI